MDIALFECVDNAFLGGELEEHVDGGAVSAVCLYGQGFHRV